MTLREKIEEKVFEMLTGSMEYNGEFSEVWDEVLETDTRTLIDYILYN